MIITKREYILTEPQDFLMHFWENHRGIDQNLMINDLEIQLNFQLYNLF